MIRRQLIVLPPQTQTPRDRDLAFGIRRIWGCALFAAGAHVFCPADRSCLDPGASSSHPRDIGQTAEGRPALGEVDGVVLSELACGSGHWTIGAGLVQPRMAGPLPGQVIASGTIADAMWSVVEQLAQLAGTELPEDLHWTDLLRRHHPIDAVEDLRAMGRRALAAAHIPHAEPSTLRVA